ncbi:ADAM DEC1 [Cricetulus griseus]|uniref:ADAM DEC1 n=1 Tax=Cricetulus griseus TaxID=10029 RepID=A0A9J7KFL3_CRIGR|nr:ADAM DEC1 [Cricetulus griseus]XP_035315070.1 ADAM DEC1 [Cricetulus griseus]
MGFHTISSSGGRRCTRTDRFKYDNTGELEGDKTGHCLLPGTSQLPTEASMSWVLLSVLWLIIQTQVTDTKSTLELKPHEIVHPKKLPISHRRGTENNQTERYGKEERYEPEVQYQIILNGEEIIFHLRRSKHLLGPDYTETSDSPKGEATRRSQDVKPCYYEGHILNARESLASISTCDGLRGYFTHHDQRYHIKPLQSTDEGEHAVLPYSQGEPDIANNNLGDKHASRKRSHLRISRSLKSPNKVFQGQKFVNLFLVLDNAFYKMYNGNVTRIKSFVFEVMDLLNVIYKTIDIQVSLVDMEIWSDSDKIKVEPRIGTTFQNFVTWHHSNLRKRKIHNHAQLLSGSDFLHGRVGMAASNSLCTSSSVSVIEAKRKNNVSLVAVMSHELGHALGMKDVIYSTKCPSGSCVMNQYLSSKFPKDFSTASRSLFQGFFSSRNARCMLLAPSPKNIIKPTCGNQVLETGEGCDCGSPEECTNLCCEPLTCRLKSQPDCQEEASNHIM